MAAFINLHITKDGNGDVQDPPIEAAINAEALGAYGQNFVVVGGVLVEVQETMSEIHVKLQEAGYGI